jgi:TRAP-type C4-dicarboxylate transport system permease small subunit
VSSGSATETAGGLIARGYHRLLDACGMIAGLAIVVLAIMFSFDVAIRNLGLGNFPWLLEVAEYTIYITTFLAAPWVLHLGAHVRVDLLINSTPDSFSKALELLVSAGGLVISGFLVYHGMLVVTEAWNLNAIVVKELPVAEWLLLVVIPVSGCLLMLEFVLRGVRVVRGEDLIPQSYGDL